jgi:hypothetical protein
LRTSSWPTALRPPYGGLRIELAEARDGQQSVRFLLGPAAQAGPFSADVCLRAHRGGPTHSLAARCYGIRGE